MKNNKSKKKTVIIIASSVLGGIILCTAILYIIILNFGTIGPSDTVEVLSKKNGIEISKIADDVALTKNNDDILDSIESGVYLYRNVYPYVYTISKDKRYTVYDYIHCAVIYQTYDLNQIDKVHRIVFEDKSRLNDLIYEYPQRKGEYPAIKFGDGFIYLQYDALQNEYYLNSKIDDEPIDFKPTERMTKGLPVNFVRKIKIEDPFIYVLDYNNFKTIVNYKTYECVYSEYIDNNSKVDLSEFNDINAFQSADSMFK
jgi:hypothetical protein